MIIVYDASNLDKMRFLVNLPPRLSADWTGMDPVLFQ